jgi:hypothetical protein
VIRSFNCSHLLTRSTFHVAANDRADSSQTKFILRSIMHVGLACCAMWLIFFVTHPVSAWAQAPATSETAQPAEEINPQYETNVKAAFLYSFGRYVDWSKESFAGNSGDFIIGVCGEDPIGQILDRIAQTKTIQGHRIIIVRMATIKDVKFCHILFVSNSVPSEQQTAIINKMRGKSSLLVGETPGFVNQGGGINFFVEGGTVRFEINVNAIRQEKLMLDAKLLNLGKKMTDATVTK